MSPPVVVDTNAVVAGLLTAQQGIVLTPMPAPPAPEPGDQYLWELLAVRADLLLITGDKRLQ